MNNILEFSKEMARDAGNLIKSKLNNEFDIEYKTSITDIVTEVDRNSEELIKRRIKENYPEHIFLGEEEVHLNGENYNVYLEKAQSIPFLWIVDPIDGTNNFVQGIPGFVVSIALLCYGKPAIAVIYDPLMDEMFWAESGKGAYMNNEKIHVSSVEDISQSVVGTSFSSKQEIRKRTLASLEGLVFKTRSVRILGSAALNLVYVGIGRLTAYWHFDLNVWDIVAGELIIKESGGIITNNQGDPYDLNEKSIVASNGKIHDDILFYLK